MDTHGRENFSLLDRPKKNEVRYICLRVVESIHIIQRVGTKFTERNHCGIRAFHVEHVFECERVLDDDRHALSSGVEKKDLLLFVRDEFPQLQNIHARPDLLVLSLPVVVAKELKPAELSEIDQR